MCHCGDVGREAEKAVEPWPVWGRVLFWVIVVAVLGASLVAALSSGRLDWASLRIVVAVVVVPGVALLVVALVSRRSASRSATRLDGELDEAGREISAEAAEVGAGPYVGRLVAVAARGDGGGRGGASSTGVG